MRSGGYILLLAAVAWFTMGCSSGDGTPIEPYVPEAQQQAQQEQESVADADAGQAEEPPAAEETSETQESAEPASQVSSLHFSHALLGTLKGDGNIFYSPYSIAGALALADAGAVGDTKKELEAALGIADITEYEKAYKEYISRERGEGAVLTTANGIWLEETLPLAEDFETNYRQQAEEYFNAGIEKADFKGNLEAVKQDISGWVQEKTEGMIEDYKSACDENTAMDIINAVYFYGEWQEPFSAGDTAEETFKGISGEKAVDMMNMSREDKRYLKDYNGITALAVPYKDESLEMDILMTADEAAANEVLSTVKALSEQELEGLFDSLDSAPLSNITRFSLPKFTMDETFPELDKTLKEVGIKRAFEGSDEFSGIARDICISRVNHRAKLEVDEEGSRAAAVTEVVLEVTSVLPQPAEEIEFIVNRPFVFFIRDNSADNILFTGYVRDL